ncbi:hypothetical protein AAVH_29732 [Aphelenchoides avenae]|nr:hypothetical protein AAVH_29732 [Aphelenchus avenae]
MQFIESHNNCHVKSSNSHGVSYFIQYFKTSDLSVGLNDTWDQSKDKEAKIVDAVLSSKTQVLCKAAKDQVRKAVDKEVFGLKDGLSGSAVVPVWFRFVWYELSYVNFTVGRTAGPSFTLTSANDGTYNSNCGQIFLFP